LSNTFPYEYFTNKSRRYPRYNAAERIALLFPTENERCSGLNTEFMVTESKTTPREVAITVVAVLIVLIVLIVLGYWLNWPWVGVNGGYNKITVTSTTHGVTTAREQPLTKTLWDWLQLLIVPIMLAIGGFWLNQMALLHKSSRRREIS
jgi:hypothetical protein